VGLLLWNVELSHRSLGDLSWIVRARGVNLDNSPSDHIAKRVIAINYGKGAQGKRKSPIESFDLFRLDLAIPEKPIDRHGPSARRALLASKVADTY